MKKIAVFVAILFGSLSLWSQPVTKIHSDLVNAYQINKTTYSYESSERSAFNYYVGKDPYDDTKIRRQCTSPIFTFPGSYSTAGDSKIGVYIKKIEIEFSGKPWLESTGKIDLSVKMSDKNNTDGVYWYRIFNNVDQFLVLTPITKSGTTTLLRYQIPTSILQLLENKPDARWAIAIVNNDESEKNNGVFISNFSIKIEYALTYQLNIMIEKDNKTFFPDEPWAIKINYSMYSFKSDNGYKSTPLVLYFPIETIDFKALNVVSSNYFIFSPNDSGAFDQFEHITDVGTTLSENSWYSFTKQSTPETVKIKYKPLKSLRPYNDLVIGTTETHISGSGFNIYKNNAWVDADESGQKIKIPIDKTIKTETKIPKGSVLGTVADHQNWDGNLLNYQRFFEFNTSNETETVSKIRAKHHPIYSQSMKVSLDGIDQSNIGIQIKDPWKVVAGSRPWIWDSYNRPFTPGNGIDAGYGGLFKSVIFDPLNPLAAHYRLKANDLGSINGVDCFFSFWGGTGGYFYNPNSLETPVRFDAANAEVTANYKGHLRTGAPERADQINQRRLVSDGISQLIVYESMGEIWLTGFNGSSWGAETRLSFGTGTAKNPSISNLLLTELFPGVGVKKCIITWVENNFVYCQPVTLGSNWSNRENSPLTWAIDEGLPQTREFIFFDSGTARADSRPVTVLYSPDGTKLRIWFGYEKNNGGVISGNYDLPALYSTNIQSGIYSPLNSPMGKSTVISTNTSDQYPVLVYQPAAQGFPEKRAVYYLGTGYASGKRIVEYSVTSNSKTVFPVSNGEYTFYSLSGGVNSTSASYTLVANAQRNLAGGVVSYDTEIYQKASYYSVTSLPSLSKIYSNATNPVVMVQNTSYIGSPVYEVNFKQGTNWYKADGGASITQIGSNVGGIFAREQVGASDRKSIFVKTTTSPASLVVYSGSGVLNKGEGTLYADVRSVRNYATLNGESKTVILDFGGALVEPVDSLENGSSICAVKLISPDQNTIIVRQPDSIKTALAIDVIRNGVAIKSYSTSLWDELSINSFENVQDGDVLVFRLGFPVASSWGYEIYDFNGTSLSKPDEATAGAVKLKKLETGVAVYPNPFNPNTSISVSLEAPASVKVMVFNILGQLVSDFGKADLGAGVHNYAFDGKTLASGTYFYRVEIGEKVKTGKLQLLK